MLNETICASCVAQLVSIVGTPTFLISLLPELPSLPTLRTTGPWHLPASHYLALSSLSPYHFLSPIIGLFCHDSCPRVVCFFLHFLPALLFEWFFPVSFCAGKTSIVSTTVGLRSTIVSESRQIALKSQESTHRSISGNSDKGI